MKKNTSWKFTDVSYVTFQSSISGPGEFSLRPNSPTPLTDDWKVTDDSSVNFHDVFFFIFCYNLAKNEEKHIMEIYG